MEESPLHQDYLKFSSQFDKIAQDQFQGPELEALVREFCAKHRKELDATSFYVRSNFPGQSSNETFEEDWRIISGENLHCLPGEPSCQNEVVGGIYWRAACASYLRITLNKSRFDREEDRAEAVNFSRLALRHTPDEPYANYWYMISIGWQLKGIQALKERMKVVRLFRAATRRCIDMDPKNPYAHHLLGRYYLEVGSLSWLQKTVAEKFMGANLNGSLADAEREFLLAHELKGDWLPTGLFMAQTLLAMKRPHEEVRKWVDFGLQLECTEPTSELERRELVALDLNLKQRSN